MSNPVLSVIGDSIRTVGGESVSTAGLKGKVLGLYFSAHWCGPCRGFTPVLSKKYTALKDAGKDFELIFISSDRDEEAFLEYHKTMSFPALPFAAREAKAKLSKMFKVSGIPTLVFVDAEGTLITDEGREGVSGSDFVDKFPYNPPPPKSVWELLGAELREPKTGALVSTKDRVQSQDAVALYFSAHWCGPCRGFTPELAKRYKALKDAGKKLEIVFISSDSDEDSFKSYHDEEMPWLALPYASRDSKAQLSKQYKVQGIPTLVFIDAKTGALINDEGRGAVTSDSYVEDFPYHPKPMYDVSESIAGINDEAALLVVMDGASKDVQAAASAALLAAAEQELAKPENDRRAGKFFTGKGGGPLDRVKQLCRLDKDAEPRMILLDLDDNGAFYVAPKAAVTADTIESFLTAFKAGALDKQTVG